MRDVVDAVTSPTTATNTSIIGLHREARGHGMRCLVVLSPELYTSAYRTPNKHEKKTEKSNLFSWYNVFPCSFVLFSCLFSVR